MMKWYNRANLTQNPIPKIRLKFAYIYLKQETD